jgi:hypothetical protein
MRKIIPMKKKVLYAAAFLFIAWAATSCEALDDCKFCKMVMTDTVTGDVNESDTETEYCGAKLLAIETAPPVVTGTTSTTWECR